MNTPNHYNQSIEPIAVIDSWDLDFRLGNVIKYIARYKQKNGLQDLEKACDYLRDKIEQEGRHKHTPCITPVSTGYDMTIPPGIEDAKTLSPPITRTVETVTPLITYKHDPVLHAKLKAIGSYPPATADFSGIDEAGDR